MRLVSAGRVASGQRRAPEAECARAAKIFSPESGSEINSDGAGACATTAQTRDLNAGANFSLAAPPDFKRPLNFKRTL